MPYAIGSARPSCDIAAMSYASPTRVVFLNMLGTLEHLLLRARDAGLSDDILLEKLTEDMFPLELQIRVALNQVILALNQVGGRALPLDEAPYPSLSAALERAAAIRSLLEEDDLARWSQPDARVDLTLPNGVRFSMSSEEDIRDWIMPNFYFHVTMVHALLRKAGLEVGKMDFMPHMARHRVDAAV